MSAVPDHLPELVEHRVVARARAKASGFDDPVFDEEFSVDRTGDSFAIEMLDAIKAGTLKTRNRITGAVLPKPDENTLFHFVHPDDVNHARAPPLGEYVTPNFLHRTRRRRAT